MTNAHLQAIPKIYTWYCTLRQTSSTNYQPSPLSSSYPSSITHQLFEAWILPRPSLADTPKHNTEEPYHFPQTSRETPTNDSPKHSCKTRTKLTLSELQKSSHTHSQQLARRNEGAILQGLRRFNSPSQDPAYTPRCRPWRKAPHTFRTDPGETSCRCCRTRS